MRLGGWLRRYRPLTLTLEVLCAEPRQGFFLSTEGETSPFLFAFLLLLFPLVHVSFFLSSTSLPFFLPFLYINNVDSSLEACNSKTRERRKQKLPQILLCTCFMIFVLGICFGHVW